MVAITQRDLPYLVLTYDPNLRGVPDRQDRERRAGLPGGRDGDIFCDQTSYAPLLTMAPVAGSVSRRRAEANPAGLAVLAAIVFGIGGWFFVIALTAPPRSASRWSSRNEAARA